MRQRWHLSLRRSSDTPLGPRAAHRAVEAAVAQYTATDSTDRARQRWGTTSNLPVTSQMSLPDYSTPSSRRKRLMVKMDSLQGKHLTPLEVLGAVLDKVARDPLVEDRGIMIRCWQPRRHSQYHMDITQAMIASCSKRRTPLLSCQGCRCGCPIRLL